MPKISVIIATPRQSELQHLRASLEADPELRLIATCPGLTETYSAVEHTQPDVVLIARDLTLAPEFEVMRALFEALDLRWLVIERNGAQTARSAPTGMPPSKPPGADLFTLDSEGSPAALLRQIRSVTHAARHALRRPPSSALSSRRSTGRIILIGASTGGVDALVKVLSTFDADCPPTIIVQHTCNFFRSGAGRAWSVAATVWN
jgi:two-component system, chemotaxis family, protein-glutamate methylesterase/glutaminase